MSIILFLILFSQQIVYFTYGEQFYDSSMIIAISSISTIFASFGVLTQNLLIIEKLQIYSFIRAFVGAILNIVLNLFLIPHFGAMGAAFSTVVSHLISDLIVDVFSQKTRRIFYIKLNSLNFVLAGTRLLRKIKD